jgi:N-hydroxyarylamine O-acetyltransferase
LSTLFVDPIEFGPVDLDAYCARIGYAGPREPTLATLQTLHHLHPAAIPFETLDARLGLGVDLDDTAIDAKLIGARRGGYCFEQNALLLRALRTIGFDAEPLIARSQWRRGPERNHPRTHMAVRVTLDGVDWLADVGFGGCMITVPLRMDVTGAQETRHEPARLTPVGDELRMERLFGEVWAPVYDLVLAPQVPVDLAAANWLIATHPASPFRNRLVVSRTQDDVRHVLVDARLTIRPSNGAMEHRDLDADQIEQSLADDFGLPVLPSWRPLLESLAS